ncbi:MAG: S8 family serine peptidase [Phycisphaerales bacterium]|nr:S8 family serine peptidase [Phycisphaerales bacterium]MCB9864300.1 S8 family serine peptidase [Phycisphaerales bacterium]
MCAFTHAINRFGALTAASFVLLACLGRPAAAQEVEVVGRSNAGVAAPNNPGSSQTLSAFGAPPAREPAAAPEKLVIDRDWLESRLHQPRDEFRNLKSDDYARQHVYVQLDPATDRDTSDAILMGVATKVRWRSQAIPGLFSIEVVDGDVPNAVNALLDSPEVIYAEPDYRQYADTDPNDSKWDDLWNMRGNDGCRAQWAWDEFTGSSNMKIAIIDSGFQTNHPDLVNNVWVNPGEIAGNGIDDDNNGYVDDVNGYDVVNDDGDPYDNGATCGGHGTHVAGIVGARGNNSTGVAGVNWQCKLVLLKLGVVNPNDATDCDLYNYTQALEYAFLTAGCRVSNNSYGSYSFEQSQFNMIDVSRAYGHIFVASAGNGGTDGVGDNNDVTPHYPDGYNLDNIISVASMELGGGRSGFSNFGSTTVDLGAPGGSVLSTIEGSSYGNKNGTSMASPHVAGAAALILGKYPDASYSTVKWRILNGVIQNNNFNQTVSGGVLNVHKSLGVWLDFGAGGSHLGTRFEPVANMADGLQKTPWTGVLNIKPANNSWTGTINQSIEIRAPEGPVTIGQ